MKRSFVTSCLYVFFVLGVGIPAFAATEIYSFDVTNIAYNAGPGELAINDSFGTDSMNGDDVEIGAGVITDPYGVINSVAWEHHDPESWVIPSLVTNGTTRLRLTYTGEPAEKPWGGQWLGGDINNWRSTTESHLAVTATNFVLGNDIEGSYYDFGASVVIPGITTEFDVEGSWYSGTYQGNQYDHAIAISMKADNWGTETELWGTWDDSPIILEGPFDPATTVVQLGIDLIQTASTTFTGWYSLNGGAPVVIASHTFEDLTISSFPDSHPGVEGDFGVVPEPGSLALFLLGLGGLGVYRRRRKG